MGDPIATQLNGFASRIADALEHIAVTGETDEAMMDAHEDGCPVCAPARAAAMKSAAEAAQPAPAEEVHKYGEEPPKAPEEPEDPETPVEVGN